jgi:hypothetical protein
VFGDKAGWINMISAEDGKLISDLKIGDNINSTPAVVDGHIYIGAFNGKLYCLGMGERKQEADGEKKEEGRKHKAVGRKKKKRPASKRAVSPPTTSPAPPTD